jgi:acetyl-CoA acetyltransferase
MSFAGKAAIVGIGATEFSKASGRSELQLAVEAVKAALDDAGVAPAEVDGLVTFDIDTNPETEIARNLGMGDVAFLARAGYGGGGACAPIQHAALAIAGGVARVVVCYRAFNERSGRRFGAGYVAQPDPYPSAAQIQRGWSIPFGLTTPAGAVALFARRYMHEHGATSEDFGRVAVAARANAATNPKAWFHGRPISLEDHQASPWIVEPLRLLDCCQESDGGVALVIVGLDAARDRPHRPAVIRGAAQGFSDDQESMSSFYRPSISGLPELGLVARQLWAQARCGPADIDAAILYDHFTPFVLPQLEEFGFCARGEARHFIADGRIALDGSLPVNPHGGLIGEAYIHGLNGVAEAVRQVRGTAVNQVRDVNHVLVTGGTGVPTSGLILGAP